VIDERQQVFNQAETLMNDINTIAGQINTNTKNQGQELVRADQNMTDVVENAEEAQKEIV
jgi:seryl-tRNA synthetase